MRILEPTGNVVPFRPRRAVLAEPKDLLDNVYTAGALPVAADDRATKAAVARLHLFGFFVVEAIGPDGEARRMPPSETSRLDLSRPWRVSRRNTAARAFAQ